MSYLLPRLRGWGDSLSRQAGRSAGIGGRGPGETKIEVDRRRIRDKMAKLRREINQMKTARDTKRQERRRNSIPSVAIAGYTTTRAAPQLDSVCGDCGLYQCGKIFIVEPTHKRRRLGTERPFRHP